MLSRGRYLLLLRVVFIVSAVLWPLFFYVYESDAAGFGLSVYWFILFTSILLHQIIYAHGIQFLHDNLVDLVWLTGDVAGLLAYVFQYAFASFYTQLPPLYMLQNVLSWCLTLLLALLLPTRVYIWFRSRKQIQSGRPFNLQNLGAPSILFGQAICNAQFSGETKMLIVARGIFANVVFISIGAFFFVKSWTGPMQELKFVPTQTLRTPTSDYTPISNQYVNGPQLGLSIPFVWGVVLARICDSGICETTGTSTDFVEAVSIAPMWDVSGPPSTRPQCEYIQSQDQSFSMPGVEGELQTISFYCPPRPVPQGIYYSEAFRTNDQPDLLVTVNFTALGMSLNSSTDVAYRSVQIMVGMTNNTNDVLQKTTPTVLIPGVNLMGLASMEVHQTLNNPGMSILGIPFLENMRSYIIAQMIHVYGDPLASDSSQLIPRAPEIATLRISMLRDLTQWKFVQDTKQNSFVSGVSQTGGLWAFLSGIFAAMFGSSLMSILFGGKPISVFGLAHSWGRGTIDNTIRAEYPAIEKEMNVPQEQRGLLSLIQDHIIDLKLPDEDPDAGFAPLLRREDNRSQVSLKEIESGLQR